MREEIIEDYVIHIPENNERLIKANKINNKNYW